MHSVLLNPIIADYNIKGTPIQRVEQMPDVGVTMDPKMGFALRRELAKKKADNNLGILKRNFFKALSMDNTKLLYGSLVRSQLEYAIIIWSLCTTRHKEQLKCAQKQDVIFLHKNKINSPKENLNLSS